LTKIKVVAPVLWNGGHSLLHGSVERMSGKKDNPRLLGLAGFPGIGAYAWSVIDDRVEWSAELLRLYGIGRAPSTEIRFTELVHPDDRLRVEAEITAFLHAGDSYEHEFRILRPDGEMRVIHDRGVIERAANGSPLFLRGINIDVSSQRPARTHDTPEAFDRELLEMALDASEQGAWVYDILTDTPTWDRRTYRIFGQPAGTPLSFERVVEELIHPDYREDVQSAVRSAMDPGGTGRYHVEHRFLRGDGEVRWIAVHGQALFEERVWGPRATRILGTVRDVTERRRTLDAVRESRELLNLALDAEGMGVWFAEFESGVYECDDATRRLFGLDPEKEAYSLDEIEERIHRDDVLGLRAAWDALEVGQPLRREIRVRGEDGAERWVAGVGVKRPAGAEGKVLAVGLNWDITERKRNGAGPEALSP
jgi:PAS domain S-box-containing protein